MILTIENILFIGSILLFISILAGKTSYKFGVPTLIFFLGVGILAGSEGIGGIQFNDPKLTQFIGIVALNFILFSGGFDTQWKSIKPVIYQGFTLSTLGVLITTLSVGVFVHFVTDFSWYEGMLLGAIVSSTDAAAVFSILRSKNLALKHNLRPTLELESGSNDPMAYFLTIAFTGLILNPDAGLLSLIPLFIRQILLGGLVGYLMGRIGKFVINRIQLDFDGLYPILVMALMFFTYTFTDIIGGNGFLAVYLCAVYLGNQELIHKKAILRAFDGFAWLMQIVLFLTLGLLVFPSEVIPNIGIGLLISLFLILIARPLSVFISLIFFPVKNRSRLFISWVGLRGAVPIVFATFPLLAGVEKSGLIFNIVFFISVTSVLIQGTSLPLFARWFHVALPQKVKPKSVVDTMLADGLQGTLLEYEIPAGSSLIGRKILDLHFPKDSLITMIRRQGKFITPNGSTQIREQDWLVILAETESSMLQIQHILQMEPVDDH